MLESLGSGFSPWGVKCMCDTVILYFSDVMKWRKSKAAPGIGGCFGLLQCWFPAWLGGSHWKDNDLGGYFNCKQFYYSIDFSG